MFLTLGQTQRKSSETTRLLEAFQDCRYLCLGLKRGIYSKRVILAFIPHHTFARLRHGSFTGRKRFVPQGMGEAVQKSDDSEAETENLHRAGDSGAVQAAQPQPPVAAKSEEAVKPEPKEQPATAETRDAGPTLNGAESQPDPGSPKSGRGRGRGRSASRGRTKSAGRGRGASRGRGRGRGKILCALNALLCLKVLRIWCAQR